MILVLVRFVLLFGMSSLVFSEAFAISLQTNLDVFVAVFVLTSLFL